MVSGMQTVIDAATLAGLRVIGHDSLTGTSWQWDRIDKNPKEGERLAISGKAIDKRDDYAAALIKRTRDGGKYIVYGGSAHSGNELEDRPSGRGLSERLGIPSVDFSTHPGIFYEREGFFATLGGAWSNLTSDNGNEIHMRKGKQGEATYKVFSMSDYALVPRAAESIFHGLDAGKIHQLQEAIREKGVCKLPANLVGKDFVPLESAVSFANGLKPELDKKPSPTRQGK